MQIDLTKLTPGQIALMTAIASIVGALLAGSFALVVALVNGWAARRNARESRQRDFRIALFQPFITYLADENWRLTTVFDESLELDSKPLSEAYRAIEGYFINSAHAGNIRTVYGHVYHDSPLGKDIVAYSKAIETMQRHAKDICALLQPHFREQDLKWLSIPGVNEKWSALLDGVPNAVKAGFILRAAFEKYLFASDVDNSR